MFTGNFNVINSNIFAYLIVDLDTLEILDGNRLANEFYLDSNGYSPFKSLFLPMIDESDFDRIIKQIENEGLTINNITSTKKSGETFICNIEFSKVSDKKLFIVIKESNFNNTLEIENLLELFDNPIFAVKLDEKLTLIYADQRCYHYMELNKQSPNKKNSSFLSIFDTEKQLIIAQTINQEIDLYGECDVDVEIKLDNSLTRLFRLKGYKSTYDGLLYGVLIGAKKQSTLLRKIEYNQQFFDIMQQFSKDLLFRIDVQKRTLIHIGDISKYIGLTNEMFNFPDCMRDNRLIHPDDLEGYIVFANRLINGATGIFDVRFQFYDGRYRKHRLQANPIFDKNGKVTQVVGKSEDIQKYEELKQNARYDILTSVLSMQSFKELVTNNISRCVASDKFALLFIDLDDFKNVNDTNGHVFGDFLLETTSKRISKCIRSHDKVGRVGQDEFVVFFQYAPRHDVVLERADAILQSIRREFVLGDLHYKITASIGIALFPEHSNTTYDDLYAKALETLYIAKKNGKDISVIYG